MLKMTPLHNMAPGTYVVFYGVDKEIGVQAAAAVRQ